MQGAAAMEASKTGLHTKIMANVRHAIKAALLGDSKEAELTFQNNLHLSPGDAYT